jgi:hypothetical protein
MSIDFKQLQTMVKEAMFTGGGINEPSYPEGVPVRMPASDTDAKEPDKGDAKANDLYEMARIAREATEKLVEALDEPIYDGAYEHAFKASACLRRALNAIEETGAHPMPTQRSAAPSTTFQVYNAHAGSSTHTPVADYGLVEEDSGLEEEKVKHHRSELSYAKKDNPSSKKPLKKAYHKAVRSQTKRNIKKGKD